MTTSPKISDDYQRGYRDGQRDRQRDNARRDYERGYRDGYGWPGPYQVYPVPYVPAYHYRVSWGEPMLQTIVTCGAIPRN